MHFLNRTDAAIKLARRLEKYRNEQVVILAIPRGGVPVGYFLSKHFHFPLDILLTKKIGHPYNPELAIGAVSLESIVIDPRMNVPKAYIDNEVKKIRKTLVERNEMFMHGKQHLNISGKIVLLVDDGIATGNTMIASLVLLRKRNPAKIVVAVPVASVESGDRICEAADDFVCLYLPEYFSGVGEFYDDFSQVSDEEVVRLLRDASFSFLV